MRFSSDMQHNEDPADDARLMIDIDGISEPQYTKLRDLFKKIPKTWNVTPVHMVNLKRGAFNINTVSARIELSYAAIIMYLNESGVDDIFNIAAGNVSWQAESISKEGVFYIIADCNKNTKIATLSVVDAPNLHNSDFGNPICIGAFYSNPARTPSGIQGLNICNDDVLVNGKYIYDIDGEIIIPNQQTLLVGEAKNAFKIKTSDKTFTIDSRMYLTVWQPIPIKRSGYEIAAMSGTWNIGSGANYEGNYLILADVVEGNPDANTVYVIKSGANFIPRGVINFIGGFYYDGTSITGVTYPGDLMIDGSPIWGSSGGGGITIDNVYPLLKQIIKSNNSVYALFNDTEKTIEFAAIGYNNVFNPSKVIYDRLIDPMSGDLVSTVVSGGSPPMSEYAGFVSAEIDVIPGERYRVYNLIDGIWGFMHRSDAGITSISLRFLSGTGTIIKPAGVGSSIWYYLNFLDSSSGTGITVDGQQRYYESMNIEVVAGAAKMQVGFLWKKISDGSVRNTAENIIINKL